MRRPSLRALAALLAYPVPALRDALPEIRAALADDAALRPALPGLERLVAHLATGELLDRQEEYVGLFDRTRSLCLNLFEHVHGDSRERGPAMIDLCKTYETAGLYLAAGELPDHLCVVLQYASTQPPAQARAFLGEIAHILQVIFSALLRRQAAHACLLAALLDLAGEKAQPVPIPAEPGLDESWAEPAAFDGCSTQGQARPGQPQPIRIVRSPVRRDAAPTPGASA